MKLRTLLTVLTGHVLVQATILVPGYAVEAHVFRCVNLDGTTYYSDIPGVGCDGDERDSLTRHGIVLDRPDMSDVFPDESTEQRRQREAEARYDLALRATYTSEQQIEDAKQRSLQAPMLSVEWGKKKLDMYRKRLVELTIREAELNKSSKPIPDAVRQDIDAAEADVVRVERELAAKRAEVEKIVARYESDKERFRRASLPPSQR